MLMQLRACGDSLQSVIYLAVVSMSDCGHTKTRASSGDQPKSAGVCRSSQSASPLTGRYLVVDAVLRRSKQ